MLKVSVFDYQFNMQKYIEKRTLEIEELESRKAFKEVVGKMFLEFYQEVTTEYYGLEERVFNEVPAPVEGPEIITNIIDRKLYDRTDEFLLPMCEEDLIERIIDSGELLLCINENRPFFLYTVFLQANYSMVCRFNDEQRIFRGVIKTQHSEYTAQFKIKKNQEYQKKIERLYKIFNLNYLPWRTVCAPYLFKLFDVYIVSIENWDVKEIIKEVVIDFEEYKEFVQYDQVPLWNIRLQAVKTSTYPEPCIDKINYEHRIFRHRLHEHTEYLVANENLEINNIRRLNGDLFITCPIANPVKWELYQFNKYNNKSRYPQYIMRNGQRDVFVEKLSSKFNQPVKTKMEIERLVNSFNYEDQLEFIAAQLIPTPNEKFTYNVDYFILDEIRVGCWDTSLLLQFRPKDKEFYLNNDIMSFLVSNIQRYFPEYHCLGELI